MADRRAVKILFETYWSSNGWKSAGDLHWQPSTPPADLAYAIQHGVMFSPWVLDHDTTVAEIVRLRDQIDLRTVGESFLASLGSGRPELASILASFAVARHFPKHTLARSAQRCAICGSFGGRREHDINVLSFERFKWGGVRHDDPVYIAFDLARFLAEDPPSPKPEDRETLRRLIDAADGMLPGSKPIDVVRAWRSAVGGGEYRRRMVFGALAFCGILSVPHHPSYLHRFVTAAERTDTPWHKDDWPYPARWWRAGAPADGKALQFWLGALSDTRPEMSLHHTAPGPH